MAKIEAISKIYRVLIDKNQESDSTIQTFDFTTYDDKLQRDVLFLRIKWTETAVFVEYLHQELKRYKRPLPLPPLQHFLPLRRKKKLQGTLNQVSLALKYNEIKYNESTPQKCFYLLKTTLSRLLGCFVLDVNVSYEYIAYICI